MPSSHQSGISCMKLLMIVVSLTATLVHASTFSRRLEQIPYLDYTGIQSAANDAVNHTVYRRNSGDSSAAYAHMAAREENDRRHYSPSTPVCKKIRKRKEWRELSYKDKKSYTRAIKCLQTKGDYGISPVTETFYDAFTQVHQTNWTDFHGNANFLPWHRWFVWIHATAMENECGYSGPVPYWDFINDYKHPSASPIFSTDPEIGFGTHGTIVRNEIGLGGYQVDNGAFANLTVNLPVPHYLTRNFSGWRDADPTGKWGYELGESYSPQVLATVLKSETFWDLELAIDGINITDFSGPFPDPTTLPDPEATPSFPAGGSGIHNGPHFLSMGDWTGPTWLLGTEWFPAGVVAPNDPMFWPHHANVDRVFWMWQQRPGKQWEFNGYKNFFTNETASATDILPFYGLGPDLPVALTLKTEDWPMCYTY